MTVICQSTRQASADIGITPENNYMTFYTVVGCIAERALRRKNLKTSTDYVIITTVVSRIENGCHRNAATWLR